MLEAAKFSKIGLLYTHDFPELRPSMSTVVIMLEGEECVNEEILKKSDPILYVSVHPYMKIYPHKLDFVFCLFWNIFVDLFWICDNLVQSFI